MNEKTISDLFLASSVYKLLKRMRRTQGWIDLPSRFVPRFLCYFVSRIYLQSILILTMTGASSALTAKLAHMPCYHRIHEILDNRMDADFQDFAALNMYIERAKALFGRKDFFAPEQTLRRSKRRGR